SERTERRRLRPYFVRSDAWLIVVAVIAAAPGLSDAHERRTRHLPRVLPQRARHRRKKTLHRPVIVDSARRLVLAERRVVIPADDVAAGIGVVCGRARIPIVRRAFAEARAETTDC